MIRQGTFVVAAVIATAVGCGGAQNNAADPGSVPKPSTATPAVAGQAAAGPPAAPAGEGALPPPVAAQDAITTVTVTPPSKDGNPFADAALYIDPVFVKKVESSIKDSPADAALLKKVEAFSTAVWLDSIAATATVGKTLDDAAAQEKKAGKPVVTVFTVYDLPDRDCAASASNGELTSAAGGEKKYAKDFIGKIASAFKAHPKQRIVAIIEPDSLANIATNLDIEKCRKATDVYKHGIATAIKELSLPNVTLYLDAAHAGWLGWSGNQGKIAKLYSEVLTDAGGANKIRGFATNVSNYDSLKGGDLAKLAPSDPCPDELTYVQHLAESLTRAGITGKGFLIDTSRNGKAGIRTKSGSWCNVKGAGLGERPQANPAPLVDAYYWVKPPGDSDGGADPAKPGYDKNCGPETPDTTPGAPHAGMWFSKYFVELCKNADPAL